MHVIVIPYVCHDLTAQRATSPLVHVILSLKYLWYPPIFQLCNNRNHRVSKPRQRSAPILRAPFRHERFYDFFVCFVFRIWLFECTLLINFSVSFLFSLIVLLARSLPLFLSIHKILFTLPQPLFNSINGRASIPSNFLQGELQISFDLNNYYAKIGRPQISLSFRFWNIDDSKRFAMELVESLSLYWNYRFVVFFSFGKFLEWNLDKQNEFV